LLFLGGEGDGRSGIEVGYYTSPARGHIITPRRMAKC